jgi:hypothetical protein
MDISPMENAIGTPIAMRANNPTQRMILVMIPFALLPHHFAFYPARTNPVKPKKIHRVNTKT